MASFTEKAVTRGASARPWRPALEEGPAQSGPSRLGHGVPGHGPPPFLAKEPLEERGGGHDQGEGHGIEGADLQVPPEANLGEEGARWRAQS